MYGFELVNVNLEKNVTASINLIITIRVIVLYQYVRFCVLCLSPACMMHEAYHLNFIHV